MSDDATQVLESKSNKQGNSNQVFVGVGMVAVVVIIIIGALIFNNSDAGQEVVVLPATIPTTSVPYTATPIPPTPTYTTSPPSDTPAVPTNTSIPPTAEVIVVTATPLPYTATPIPPTNTPAPTVLYPSGRLLELYYNQDSFVMWNGGPDSFRLNQIGFEAIDSISRFEGIRCARMFHSAESQSCAAINSQAANPGKCRTFNSTVYPNSTESFWIIQNDISHFRVLWNDEEIGRCEIAAGSCTVYAPD